MALVEVSCPKCHAPVEAPANSSVMVKCRFCGASLRDPSAPAPRTRTVFEVVLERVGPSNEARAWKVLTTLGVHPTAAQGLIENAPSVCFVVDENERAHEMMGALREAGMRARVNEREILVPEPVVLPDRSVHLQSVGEDKIAVIMAIREHADVGLADAKELAEGAPCVLVRSLEGSRAAAFVEALTNAGAVARLDKPS